MNMDAANDLTERATRAIGVALKVHNQDAWDLSDLDKEEIHDHVNGVLRLQLRDRLHDWNVDNATCRLEICCEAAMYWIEKFNSGLPPAIHISPKWFYCLVETILAIDMKPAMFHGEVKRLGFLPETEPREFVDLTESIDDEEPPGELGVSDDADAAGGAGLSIQQPVTKNTRKGQKWAWMEHEIKQVCWDKEYKGLKYDEIATRLSFKPTGHAVRLRWAKAIEFREAGAVKYRDECRAAKEQGLGEDAFPRPVDPHRPRELIAAWIHE